MVWGGRVYTQADVDTGRVAPGSTVYIGEELYLGAPAGQYDRERDDRGDFVNHSCDPNVWLADENTLVARRDLAVGEELTIDYALFEGDESDVKPWRCRCGSPLCRGTVTGRDWRSPELQARYRGHFSPFLEARINRLSRDRTRAAYDRLAPAYVERNVLPSTSPAVLEMVDRFTGLLPVGARVLDLGCGPAHESGWLRERGLDPIAGDLSDGMLAQARRFFPGGPLVQLDMRALPFADRSFAAVWCMASLLHIPKSEAPGVLAEAHRVLHGHDLLALAVQEGDGERWDGGYVEGVERFFARYSPDQARKLIEQAGFDVEWHDRNVTATPNRVWLRFLARARR